MIERQLLEQVEQMLTEGKLSYRKIARFTGVSRGTIGAIASGRRRIQPKRTCFWEEEPLVPDVPPERCPDCGGMVYMPCRACRTRKEMAKTQDIRALVGPHPNPLRAPTEGWSGEGTIRAIVRQPFTLLGLNLKPVHQQRYEEVRRWRVALAEPVAPKREQQEGSGFRTQVQSQIRSFEP
jgi:hypothetical protein